MLGARPGAGDPVVTGTLKEEIQVVRVPPCRLENTNSTSVSALGSTVNNFKKWNCSSLIFIPNYAPDSTMLGKKKKIKMTCFLYFHLPITRLRIS